WILDRAPRPPLPPPPPGRRRLVLTSHRRESFGRGLEGICEAIRRLVERLGEALEVVVPVHPNPRVKEALEARLAGLPRVSLIPPLPYPAFVALMGSAYLVLSDSGGVQEEAPSLHKPVVVLRDKTERPEAIAAGCARLVGTEPAAIVDAVLALWHDRAAYRRMAGAANPFGDGRAAERIAGLLCGRAVEPFRPPVESR
ncbi:MAG: UDP-N-acetylglucosamine 2-epimerase (non-hydrolyzing), partial [Acidobacteria bacterium]